MGSLHSTQLTYIMADELSITYPCLGKCMYTSILISMCGIKRHVIASKDKLLTNAIPCIVSQEAN